MENAHLGERLLKMRTIKVSKVMKVTSTIADPPPWHDEVYLTFYIQGFGFVFEAMFSDVLKAEYKVNLEFQKTHYITMDNILFVFGLPNNYIDGQKYYWDYRSEESIFSTIDFQHERMFIDCNGDEIECVVISFRQTPEIKD